MRWVRAAWRHRWALWCGLLALGTAAGSLAAGGGADTALLVVVLGFAFAFGGAVIVDRLYRAGILRGARNGRRAR